LKGIMNCLSVRNLHPGLRCLALAMAAQLSITAAVPAQSKVTWVRGRVEWKGKPNYPAAKIAVSFVPRGLKGDKSRTKLVYTGSNGMYDFHVAAGTYILTVRWSEKDSRSFLIQVSDKPNLDIAPIVIP
jgi:hypothetical protein